MEHVYPRVPRTDTRELYLRETGASRVAYVPWDIGRTFWEVMSPDHGRLLRNLVAWTTNEPAPVEVAGPGPHRRHRVASARLDDGAPRQSDQSHDDERTACARRCPWVRSRCAFVSPQALVPAKVHLLTAGSTPRTTTAGGVLTVTVPSVDVHEVIAIDL